MESGGGEGKRTSGRGLGRRLADVTLPQGPRGRYRNTRAPPRRASRTPRHRGREGEGGGQRGELNGPSGSIVDQPDDHRAPTRSHRSEPGIKRLLPEGASLQKQVRINGLL